VSVETTCAVVGLGSMGSQHAAILANLPIADLAICCDTDPDSEGRCPPGVPFTTELADVLSQPNLKAVVVATPDDSHCQVVVNLLERGLHVLCEKPIAIKLDDADLMIRAEASSAGRLTIGHVVRFDPRYLAVRDAVWSGRLGSAVHITTRRNCSVIYGRRLSATTTLPMYLSVHDLDLMEWIMRSQIVRVYAEGATSSDFGNGMAASVVATLRFANGAVGTHEVSWALPEAAGLDSGDFGLSYVGTGGAAYVDLRSQGVSIYGGVEVNNADQCSRGHVEHPGMARMIDGMPVGNVRSELEHFLMTVDGHFRPMTTGDEGRRALKVALALEKALTTGAVVNVVQGEGESS
jgi:UDP-N-acetylglucosamine 3-dehydrogenase